MLTIGIGIKEENILSPQLGARKKRRHQEGEEQGFLGVLVFDD